MRRGIEKLTDIFQFYIRFLKSPSTVGSIFPSSSRLAKKIIKKISWDEHFDQPRRYLEVGAGTGVFTERIIAKMKPTDFLDVVEFNPHFCNILRKKFRHFLNVTIHETCILAFEAEKYDALISGLPLNSLNADFVNQVLKKYQRLTKKGGYVSYFEYIGLAKIKKLFLYGDSRIDFTQILGHKQLFLNHFREETDKIWLNFTPATVHHCKIK